MSRDSFYPFEGSMHRDTFTHPARTFKSIDVPNVLIRSYRSLVFRMRMDDARLHWLLTEFRLIVTNRFELPTNQGFGLGLGLPKSPTGVYLMNTMSTNSTFPQHSKLP